jgi:hypothetical protein
LCTLLNTFEECWMSQLKTLMLHNKTQHWGEDATESRTETWMKETDVPAKLLVKATMSSQQVLVTK